MNNKVNFLRGTSAEYESSIKDNDTFYYTTDTEKLYLGDKEITGSGITVDDTLSDTSEHPVQNKVIKQALDGKVDSTDISTVAKTGSYNDLTNKPTIPDAVTESTVSGWGFTKNTGTYSKPSGGIPKSDLATDVQTSLGKADSALQEHQSLAGYVKTTDSRLSDARTPTAHTHTKSEISDFPDSLPANGGNADTVDNKHAVDIMNMEFNFSNRTSITEGDINNYTTAGAYVVLQAISADVLANQPWTDRGYYLDVYRRNGTLITQIAMNWAGDIKIQNLSGTTWTSWKNINDGGAADSANYAGSLASTASNRCLRNLSSGTADVTTTNCPTGTWYGIYE